MSDRIVLMLLPGERRAAVAATAGRGRGAGAVPPAASGGAEGRASLDRGADVREERLDLAAQEDEGDDRDDGDEGEDQRVLREPLAFLVASNGGKELLNENH